MKERWSELLEHEREVQEMTRERGMTQALDAAVRAACDSHCTDGRATENWCTHPKCGCTAIPDLARAALRAALPSDPPEGEIAVMTTAFFNAVRDPQITTNEVMVLVRRALRAYLLGEDA